MKLFFLLFCLVSAAMAAPQAQVVLLKGSASYAGRPMAKGDLLTGKGQIKVNDKSYLKLRLSEGGHTVVMAANSVGQLNFERPSESDSIGLLKGYARWISGSNKKGPQAGIRTKNATMGVRGTNFMSLYNEVLGETEIWVFDGEVDFTNAANKADNKRLTKNQWGGIGGRFGKNCQEVLTLPPHVVKMIDDILPVE